MKTSAIRCLSILALLAGLSINSAFPQLSKDAALYASNKLEEKKTDFELFNLKAARSLIEKQYRKMEIAQKNVDINMLFVILPISCTKRFDS